MADIFSGDIWSWTRANANYTAFDFFDIKNTFCRPAGNIPEPVWFKVLYLLQKSCIDDTRRKFEIHRTQYKYCMGANAMNGEIAQHNENMTFFALNGRWKNVYSGAARKQMVEKIEMALFESTRPPEDVYFVGLSVEMHERTTPQLMEMERWRTAVDASNLKSWAHLSVFVVCRNENWYLVRWDRNLLMCGWKPEDGRAMYNSLNVPARFTNAVKPAFEYLVVGKHCRRSFSVLAFCRYLLRNFDQLPRQFLVKLNPLGLNPLSRESVKSIFHDKLTIVTDQFQSLTPENIVYGWKLPVNRRLFFYNDRTLENISIPGQILTYAEKATTTGDITPALILEYVKDVPIEFRADPQYFTELLHPQERGEITRTIRAVSRGNETEPRIDDSTACKICFQSTANYLLMPCRHTVCTFCSKRVNYCPFCQIIIKCGLKIFV